MKKIYLISLSLCAFFIISTPVFATAQSSTGSAIQNLKNKIQEQKDQILQKKEIRTQLKEDVRSRIRISVTARVEVYSKAINRASALLDKLDTKIAGAEKNGKNMTEVKILQADSRTKLEDAKIRLAEIESKKGTAVDKETFLEIRDDFKNIWQDLHQIKLNSARIISTLKSFNSTDSSKSGTISGSVKAIKISD